MGLRELVSRGRARFIIACVVVAWAIVGGLFLWIRPDRPRLLVPSEAMKPTINPGDHIRIDETQDIERGDVIVFEVPTRVSSEFITELVSRVIALPGETITVASDGTVFINDRKLTEPYVMPGSVTALDEIPPGCGEPSKGEVGCVVPRGRVFVMSDNRQLAKDSRSYGPIPIKSIRGKKA